MEIKSFISVWLTSFKNSLNVMNADFFTLTYRVLIGKEKGPKLAGFIKTVGKDKILEILSKY